MSAAEASAFHGHSPKRFLLSCADSLPSFDDVFSNEVGRFSGSVAQSSDLEPTEAMLRQHSLRCSVLPAIYSNKARVPKAFSRLARLHRAVLGVALRAQTDPSLLSRSDPWEAFRSAA